MPEQISEPQLLGSTERTTTWEGEGTRQMRALPGPRGLPLLGVAHKLDVQSLHAQLEAWAGTYGSVYTYRMGTARALAISDPTAIGHVLRDRPIGFRRVGNLKPIIDELIGPGVFAAEGQDWQPQRKLSTAALAMRNLRGFYPCLADIAGRLHRRWLRMAEKGEVLDLNAEFQRFSVDVASRLAFGYDINTLERDDDTLYKLLEILFPAANRRLFSLLPWRRWLGLPQERAADAAALQLRTWLLRLLSEAKGQLQDAGSDTIAENFLQAMVLARDDEGKPFADEVVVGNLATMLLAGEETTAHSLAWAVHLLMDAPVESERLRADSCRVLATSIVPETLETAQQLDYALCVTHESMRLRSVTPLVMLEADVDTVVAGVQVPKGTSVALLTRKPALDPTHFAEPGAFRPERFLPGAPLHPHTPNVVLPFGSGPRMCPGRALALLEMQVALATLYRNFDVERVGKSEEVTENFALTVSAQGLRARLHARAAPSNSRVDTGVERTGNSSISGIDTGTDK